MRKKILIVDDEIGICKMLKIFLEKNSFVADVSQDGRGGLMEALNKNYDLIILDFLLPGMDGFYVLKKLREFKSTPVIMLSSQDDENVINFFLQSGANDFVVKPFNCMGVIEKINKLLS